MADSRLVLHCGAREVTREELDTIQPPLPTRTWRPIAHATVLEMVSEVMRGSGFTITKVRIGVARDNHRLFATIDTAAQLNCGSVTLAVAVVNSTDKSLPMKFIAGNRTFCCDNLALRSDLMEPVRKKHTTNGLDRFREALGIAVGGLDQFQQAERADIKRFQETEITNTEAESVLLRCFERGVLSHRLLPQAIREWRDPSFKEFRSPCLWSLKMRSPRHSAPCNAATRKGSAACHSGCKRCSSEVAPMDATLPDASLSS